MEVTLDDFAEELGIDPAPDSYVAGWFLDQLDGLSHRIEVCKELMNRTILERRSFVHGAEEASVPRAVAIDPQYQCSMFSDAGP
jgi:hypothetical protein